MVGGGVGNQLFQYAAARALALRRGVPLMIDTRRYRTGRWPIYGLGAFAIEALPPDATLPREDRKAWRQVLNRVIGPGGQFTVFREAAFAFDRTVLSLPDWTYLYGNFQSVRYFADQEATLRRDLVFVAPMRDASRAIADEIAATTAVSLHIRRGDYVTDPRANRVHEILDLDFYRRAAGLIAQQSGATPTFFVFSDDREWIADNLRLDFPLRLITHNDPSSAAEDLRLMAACRHHIIANSSFSWWGAWLNPSPDKIVVAPKAWFRDTTKDDSALIPAEWIRV